MISVNICNIFRISFLSKGLDMMSNDVLDRNEDFLDHKNVTLTYM